MFVYKPKGRLKIAVPLILLGMILMRLVWMQLRDYPVVANYRSLITINELHETLGSACPIGEEEGRDIGLQNFVQSKDLAQKPIYQWFNSPISEFYYRVACQNETFDAQYLLRTNQWLFVVSIAVCTLMMRLLTGTWIVAMIGAATLLSRGRLVATSGDLNWNTPIALFITLWICAGVHFFRTGSLLSLAASAGIVLLGSFFDPSLMFLSLTMPLLLASGYLFKQSLAEPVLLRLRTEKKRIRALMQKGRLKAYGPDSYPVLFFDFVQRLLGKAPGAVWLGDRRGEFMRGSLFETIRIPFALWANHNRRWLKIALFWVGFGSFNFAVLLLFNYSQLNGSEKQLHLAVNTGLSEGFWFLLETWFHSILDPIDLHLAASLLVIIFCALQSPAEGLVSFFESAWLILFSIMVTLIGAAVFDYADMKILSSLEGPIGAWTIYAWSRGPEILRWFEPVVLCMGIAGIYNLFKVARAYLPDQAR